MGEWKIIVGKEDRVIIHPSTKESRNTTYYQIVTHDGFSYVVGDYEITEDPNARNVVEIDGVLYAGKGSQKYMSDFNGIINVYIREWKIAKPEYDIADMKSACDYFKKLISLKNELLGLK